MEERCPALIPYRIVTKKRRLVAGSSQADVTRNNAFMDLPPRAPRRI